ncbi:hypothetical protein RCL1_001398 [Eukaryota sp. TZLM3-RCL]
MESVYTPLKGNVTFGVAPSDQRRFRDIPFAVLFFLAIALFCFLSFYGWKNGDPERVLNKAQNGGLDTISAFITNLGPIGCSIIVACVLAVLWLQLLRWFAGFFVKLTIFITEGALIAGGFFMYINKNGNSTYAAYLLWGMAALFSLLCFLARHKIAFTIVLFTEGTKAINNSPGTMILSILFIAKLFILTGMYLFFSAFILTITGVSDECPIDAEPVCKEALNLWYVYSFIFIWFIFFLNGFVQTTIAGSVASFAFNQSSSAIKSVINSIYAIGSIALGSFLIAIITAIKIVVEFLREKAKKKGDNLGIQLLLCVISCIVKCFERIIKYISHYAYIFIAKDGSSFCSATRDTFKLLSYQPFTMVAVDSITNLVLLMGKLMGTAATLVFAGFVFSAQATSLDYIVVGLLAFAIMNLISKVIVVAVDTFLVCYFASDVPVAIDDELSAALNGYKNQYGYDERV